MDESGFQVLIEEAIGSIWASEMALFLFFPDIKLSQRPRWEKKLISTSEKHQMNFMKHTSLQEHPIET
jgi:hypothetical protein